MFPRIEYATNNNNNIHYKNKKEYFYDLGIEYYKKFIKQPHKNYVVYGNMINNHKYTIVF